MCKPFHQVAIAMVRREGRWLVARRHPDAHLGGLWEFPGGKLHADESCAAAALRELREECGVEAAVDRVLSPVLCQYSDRTVELTGVVCQWCAGEAAPLGNAECRWVTPDELLTLAMPAVNAGIIAAALHAT